MLIPADLEGTPLLLARAVMGLDDKSRRAEADALRALIARRRSEHEELLDRVFAIDDEITANEALLRVYESVETYAAERRGGGPPRPQIPMQRRRQPQPDELTGIARQIYDALDGVAGATRSPTALADALRLNVGSVRVALNRMVRAGLVIRAARGRYQLAGLEEAAEE